MEHLGERGSGGGSGQLWPAIGSPHTPPPARTPTGKESQGGGTGPATIAPSHSPGGPARHSRCIPGAGEAREAREAAAAASM